MLVRGPPRPENRPRETLTQRLERLRLEHRRHVRNAGNGPSRSMARELVRVGPTLPDTNLPTAANAPDTWNDDRAGTAIRPRPAQPLVPNAGLNGPPPPDRLPAHGPPPPRSWVSPQSRNVHTNLSPSATRNPHSRTVKPKKGSKKAARGMTAMERLRSEEEEMMEKIYADEYWFRPAGDVRWSAWREEALRLAFSYSAGSVDAGRQVLTESPFIPFETQEKDSRVPTLFETILKLIFTTRSHDRHGEEQRREEEYSDSLELVQVLPPHIRKRVLRYTAAHRPLTLEQLRGMAREEFGPAEVTDLMDSSQTVELILSGRQVEAGFLAEVLAGGEDQENSDLQDVRLPPMSPLQSIVLFQTPFLQKRHLLSFPKTITTLGLISLPPPKGLSIHKASTAARGNMELHASARCSCPWCADATMAPPNGTNSSQSRSLSSSSSFRTPPISSLPHTSSTLIPHLATLPELLPSLVILDVSYNPWMASDTVLQNADQKELSRCRKGERTEPMGHGILGTWDLRLWGRIRILGVKGCFESLSFGDSVGGVGMGASFPGETDPLADGEIVDSIGSAQHCACGVRRGGEHEWRRDALLRKWEKTVYAVGRSVEVVWREPGCRCGVDV